jgi:hypothetical protein
MPFGALGRSPGTSPQRPAANWARERSWSWSIAGIPASWAWALLLLDELFGKRPALAHGLGLGLDVRYRELRLDIHLLELPGILVVIGAEGLGVLNPPDGNTALLVVAPHYRRQRRDSHGRLNRSAGGILRDLVLLEVRSERLPLRQREYVSWGRDLVRHAGQARREVRRRQR